MTGVGQAGRRVLDEVLQFISNTKKKGFSVCLPWLEHICCNCLWDLQTIVKSWFKWHQGCNPLSEPSHRTRETCPWFILLLFVAKWSVAGRGKEAQSHFHPSCVSLLLAWATLGGLQASQAPSASLSHWRLRSGNSSCGTQRSTARPDSPSPGRNQRLRGCGSSPLINGKLGEWGVEEPSFKKAAAKSLLMRALHPFNVVGALL